MGLVSQDCLLFQGTLEDNIRYGTQHATSQQVVEAAKAAYAHDFISAMPHVSGDTTLCSARAGLAGWRCTHTLSTNRRLCWAAHSIREVL